MSTGSNGTATSEFMKKVKNIGSLLPNMGSKLISVLPNIQTAVVGSVKKIGTNATQAANNIKKSGSNLIQGASNTIKSITEKSNINPGVKHGYSTGGRTADPDFLTGHITEGENPPPTSYPNPYPPDPYAKGGQRRRKTRMKRRKNRRVKSRRYR